MTTSESLRCAGAPFVIGTAGPTVLHESLESIQQQVERVLEDLVCPALSDESGIQRILGPLVARLFKLERRVDGRIFTHPIGLAHTPLLVLSSLAPGADTEIATLILDWCQRNDHPVALVAALPFPPEVYEKVSSSFNNPHDTTARDRFRKLIDAAAQVFVVRRSGEESVDDATLAAKMLSECLASSDGDLNASHHASEHRNERYELAASYVSAFSDLLITCCTDAEINRPGEAPKTATTTTARCIAAKLHGEINPALPCAPVFSWAEDGPVVWIKVERRDKDVAQPGTIPQAGEANVQFAFPRGEKFGDGSDGNLPTAASYAAEAERHLQDVAARLDEFNRVFTESGDCVCGILPASADMRRAARELRQFHPPLARLHFDEDSNLPEIEDILTALEGASVECRAIFDMHLRRNRAARMERPVSKKATDTLTQLFWLIGGAAAFAHLYGHGGGWPSSLTMVLLMAALVFAAAAFLAHKLFVLRKTEVNSLDWRAIAEGLRVQIAWAAAGLSTSVPSCYLHRFRSELDWVRNALSAWSFPYARWRIAFDALSPADQILRLRTVGESWVKGQLDYYRNQARKRKHIGHRAHLAGSLLSLAGVGLLVLLLAGEVTVHHFAHKLHAWHLLLLIASGLCLLIGALVLAHSEKSLNAEHARRYQGMFRLMEAAHRRLDTILLEAESVTGAGAPGKIREAQALLEALGREALTENAEWLLLHRARPVELPTAG